MSRGARTPSESARSTLVLGVLVSGRGSNLQSILQAIEQGKLSARVGVVLSSKKEAPALQRAAEYSVPSFFVDPAHHPDRREYDSTLLRKLEEHGVELVILAGYMRLITPTLIAAYRNHIINVHPSLLPAFPGLRAQRQALEYGARISGCTVHFVDEEVDHGPIIAQAAVPIFEGDTEEQLSDRILVEEHRLLPHVIQLYADGRLKVEGRGVRILEGDQARMMP